ncbi:MAG: hypothetical protein M3083_09435 [Actinomycetota bacterium]|nr:hypothetical protein [Actinomycetota bacterium]MDQ6945235.1 hypothetical protein [Actinomycetota bacterium]
MSLARLAPGHLLWQHGHTCRADSDAQVDQADQANALNLITAGRAG